MRKPLACAFSRSGECPSLSIPQTPVLLSGAKNPAFAFVLAFVLAFAFAFAFVLAF
jgi:hypothetical protein